MFAKILFSSFSIDFTAFPEQRPFVETNTKCSFSAEFFGNNWKNCWEDDIVLLRWNHDGHPLWSHRHHDEEEMGMVFDEEVDEGVGEEVEVEMVVTE